VSVQALTVDAAINSDPERVVQAMAMDPLTSACCTLSEIREMATELLEAEREWLPLFDGKSVRPVPFINVPEDVQGVEVPLDPALAIGKRFVTLASQSKI
jgi:alpha-galactosidase